MPESDPNALRVSGKPVMACSPLYPPVELIHAAGFCPLVLWELNDLVADTEESDTHIQPYCCSIARRMLEYMLSHHGDDCAAFLTYNACDTIRNLPEIVEEGLRTKGHRIPALRFHLPAANSGGGNARSYLASQIQELRTSLVRISGYEFPDDEFRSSVELYRKLRNALLLLETEVRRGAISFVEYARYGRQLHLLPAEEVLTAVENAHEQAKKQPDQNRGIDVVISGIVPPPDEVICIMEASGLNICANDVASLHRAIAFTPESFSGLEDYYQQFYEGHFPCPTLLPTAGKRVDALLALAKNAGAKGIIFIGEKFCEYEFFEYPYLMKRFAAVGLPCLLLEMAIDGVGIEAQKTRIEAFVELLTKA